MPRHHRHVDAVRVSLFVPSMRGGGAERVFADLANEFAARGLSVDLVLAEAAGCYLDELRPGVNIVDLGGRRVLFSVPALIRHLRQTRPGVILSAMGHCNIASIVSAKLARSGTRVVVSERGAPRVRRTRRKMGLLTSLLARILYPRAHQIIAVSEGVARELADLLRVPLSRIVAIHNPLDLDNISRLSRLPIPAGSELLDAKLFLGVGRLIEVKGFDNLLQAFSLVAARIPSQLILLGAGPSRTSLELLATNLGIADRVQFLGFDPNPYRWMRIADAFVLSSRSEGSPNSLLQAMACGTPVVSTNCAYGPEEILEQGKWGELVPVDDSWALADAMIRAVTSPTSPRVQERALSFSLPAVADAYLEAMDIVLIPRTEP